MRNELIKINTDDLIIDDQLRNQVNRNLTAFLSSTAENTRINLARILKQYQQFCFDNQFMMFPLSETTIGKFIDFRNHTGVLGRTVDTDIALLKTLDSVIANKKSTIRDSQFIANKLKALRKNDRKKAKAKGIHCEEIDHWFDCNLSRHQDHDFIRAAALFKTAYNGLLRISEICTLRVEDIDFENRCIELAQSKTDQEGQGESFFLWQDTIEALKKWISIASLSPSDPLFWSIFSGKKLKLRAPISTVGIRNLIKKELGRDCSGHGFRVGACEDMVQSDLSQSLIMQAGRWTDPKMVALYSKKLSLKKGGMSELEGFFRG